MFLNKGRGTAQCTPTEDSAQPVHQKRLIRVVTRRSIGTQHLIYSRFILLLEKGKAITCIISKYKIPRNMSVCLKFEYDTLKCVTNATPKLQNSNLHRSNSPLKILCHNS